ncbi:MAG TPA: hydrogenase maturation nickel metallochaperone HypA [bacterium]|nr:hydrogenase maturation nickel metallochaperone HypA [bacterium]
MHEFSITQELVKVVDEARVEGGGNPRVLRVKIVVGGFTAVVPDCVRHYFKMLVEGTRMEGAELDFEVATVTASCAACGNVFDVVSVEFSCPSCGGGETDIVSGRELFVDSIEVVD